MIPWELSQEKIHVTKWWTMELFHGKPLKKYKQTRFFESHLWNFTSYKHMCFPPQCSVPPAMIKYTVKSSRPSTGRFLDMDSADASLSQRCNMLTAVNTNHICYMLKVYSTYTLISIKRKNKNKQKNKHIQVLFNMDPKRGAYAI